MCIFKSLNNNIKTLFVIIFLHLNYFGYSQWSHIDLPTIDGGVEISFPDSNFGVVSTGSFYKTYDRGNSWTQFYPNKYVMNIVLLTRDTGIAYDFNNREIVKSTDGGLNWLTVFTTGNIPANSSFTNIFFLPDHMTGYMMFMSYNSGDSIYCVKTMDGGNSWNIITAFFSVDYPGMNNLVKFVDANTGYFILSHEIYETIDGGQTWQLKYTFQNDLTAMQPFSEDTVVAISYYYDVMRSVDGGQTWLPCTTAANAGIYDICFSNDTGYIFGGNGINSGFVLSSVDRGENWTLVFNDNGTYHKVNSSPGNIIFATGDNGAVITNNRLFTSVNEIDRNNFTFYPNPVSDQLNLNISSNEFDYNIRDAIGNIVLTGKDSKNIQTGILNNGYYNIEIVSSSNRLVKSMVVMH